MPRCAQTERCAAANSLRHQARVAPHGATRTEHQQAGRGQRHQVSSNQECPTTNENPGGPPFETRGASGRRPDELSKTPVRVLRVIWPSITRSHPHARSARELGLARKPRLFARRPVLLDLRGAGGRPWRRPAAPSHAAATGRGASSAGLPRARRPFDGNSSPRRQASQPECPKFLCGLGVGQRGRLWSRRRRQEASVRSTEGGIKRTTYRTRRHGWSRRGRQEASVRSSGGERSRGRPPERDGKGGQEAEGKLASPLSTASSVTLLRPAYRPDPQGRPGPKNHLHRIALLVNRGAERGHIVLTPAS